LETIPKIDAKPEFSRWQDEFFCEFDGTRGKRLLVMTLLAG
jgi:thiamine phosphate synthase YjbQ (UPF0047 family)